MAIHVFVAFCLVRLLLVLVLVAMANPSRFIARNDTGSTVSFGINGQSRVLSETILLKAVLVRKQIR